MVNRVIPYTSRFISEGRKTNNHYLSAKKENKCFIYVKILDKKSMKEHLLH